VVRRGIGAAFVVQDSAGQKLAYAYFEHETGRGGVSTLLNLRLKKIGRVRALRLPHQTPLNGLSK
jgi:hypothetical protein